MCVSSINFHFHNINKKTIETNNLLKRCRLTEWEARELMATQAQLKEIAFRSVLVERAKMFGKQLGPDLISFVHHVLGLLITLTALDQLGGGVDQDTRASKYSKSNPLEAQATLTTYLTIIAYPATLYLLLFAFFHAVIPAVIATAAVVVTSISLLILYNKYWRPTPRDCEGLDNLSHRMRNMDADPILPRKDILDKMERAFDSNKGVLLVGDSGTGKSSIVKTLAERLKNKQVFAANSADINPFEGLTLEHVRKRYNHHAKKVVFFFDEIHAVMKPSEMGKTNEDSFLTFCDQFPYVIGATTTKQYEEFIKGKAPFERRFEVIHVKPLEKVDVEAALYEIVGKKNPELILEPGIISNICDRTQFKIDAAVGLLSRAIAAAARPNFEKEESALAAVSKKVRSLELKLVYENETFLKEYQALKREQFELQNALDEKKRELGAIQKLEKEFLATKLKGYKITKLNPWLKNKIHLNTLMEEIEKKRQALGLSGRLDKKLLDALQAPSQKA